MELTNISTTANPANLAVQSMNNFVLSMEEWVDLFGSTKTTLNFGKNEQLITTGCLTLPVSTSSDTRKRNINAPVLMVRFVCFLLNFRVLWDHFSKENFDHVTDCSPLFQLYVELFFHKHTVQLMMILSVYYLVAMVVCNSLYVVSPPAASAVFYFGLSLQTFVYLTLVVLLKGSLLSVEHTYASSEEKITEMAKENDTKYWRAKQYLGCFVYFKTALRKSFSELNYHIQNSFCAKKRLAEISAYKATQKPNGFYETMNNGLKFLSKHKLRGDIRGNKFDLDRPVHNFKLLFIFFAVPVYMITTTYISPYGPVQRDIGLCNANGWDSTLCKNVTTLFMATLGYSIPTLLKSIFISSVLLSLVGLSFGAEIGCALVDSWILRFGSLRTLKMKGSETEPEAATADYRAEDGRVGTENDRDIEEGGGVRRAGVRLRVDPGSIVLSAMHSQQETPAAAQHVPDNDMSVRSPELYIYLQRDSYEHFLYVREFMAISSRAWSFTIFTLTFTGLYFIVMFTVGAISSPSAITTLELSYYIIWVAIRVGLLSIYPVMALAHANAYVYALQEQFLVAAPEDFAVIGGRDSWLEYLDKVPAMWTIYGVNITWDRLSGLLWTTVAGLGAIAISSFAGSR